MPWCALDSLFDADSNECWLAWNGYVMAKKSGFHVVCPNLFLFDSPCLLWFLKIWCYIIVPWWLMMLLVWLIMDSRHLEISICILVMKACCCYDEFVQISHVCVGYFCWHKLCCYFESHDYAWLLLVNDVLMLVFLS